MNEPLSLPRGSVRAILAILVCVVAALTLFVPIAEGAGDARALFVGIAGIVLRDYFHSRKEQNEQDGPTLPEPAVRGE